MRAGLIALTLFVSAGAGTPCVVEAQAAVRGQSAAGVSLPPALRAMVDHLADSARALNVPTEALYLKSAEGVLKGASDDRIESVLRRLLSELVESRRALGAEASGAEVAAGATVIHARVDPALLRRLRDAQVESRTGGSLVVSLVVLADLVARRVSPDVATASITALAQRGTPDQELTTLRSSIEREIAGGQAPDVATRSRTAVMLREPAVRP
jgi:hypothetical protein